MVSSSDGRIDIAGNGSRSGTATQIVHRRLRDEIISLKRLPGAPISEKEIAAESGLSRTPVREALLRLAEEQLVDIVPKSGTTVSKIPVASLLEAQVARTALEQVNVRAAALRVQGSEIASMRALLVLQRERMDAGDSDQFHAADEALHRAIAVAGGYPGIWKVIEQVKLQVDRYRRLTLPQINRMERVIVEHAEIVDALAAKDAARAVAAMTHHLEGLSAEDLRPIRDLNPDYFIGDIKNVYEKWSDASIASQNERRPAHI